MIRGGLQFSHHSSMEAGNVIAHRGGDSSSHQSKWFSIQQNWKKQAMAGGFIRLAAGISIF